MGDGGRVTATPPAARAGRVRARAADDARHRDGEALRTAATASQPRAADMTLDTGRRRGGCA
ncbi:hypothetical protein XFF6166_70012 [Xanthomonas citri pv. fuscans]|nr:hypothetical protein XFF6166_70012 [Xanthomonas citri pv. fuscans]SON95600.1 hypothetical protein XFF7767_100009 [Xanthomonas citri pv. fuscans]SOO02072.1 hypothetical protein XFF6960_570033 [Xanthomonas citri pv. fuscans]SOO09505.1 hypothetical protein XFF6970_390027 [Xanthomonas citri pv. fuscans]SOO14772.1 hypothetical protein XFF7766_380013 [Xanthomonas citri pv. fuscans]